MLFLAAMGKVGADDLVCIGNKFIDSAHVGRASRRRIDIGRGWLIAMYDGLIVTSFINRRAGVSICLPISFEIVRGGLRSGVLRWHMRFAGLFALLTGAIARFIRRLLIALLDGSFRFIIGAW
ncbi:MAG: hypothetical protein ACJ8HJ_18485, partial [Massilia sp.]